jgi:hypothetical protein
MMVYNTQNYWVLWTFSIVWYSREHGVLETGSVSAFRWRWGRRHLLSWAPLKELISITGQPLSDLHSYMYLINPFMSQHEIKKIGMWWLYMEFWLVIGFIGPWIFLFTNTCTVYIYALSFHNMLYSVSTKSLRGFEKLWRANKLS